MQISFQPVLAKANPQDNIVPAPSLKKVDLTISSFIKRVFNKLFPFVSKRRFVCVKLFPIALGIMSAVLICARAGHVVLSNSSDKHEHKNKIAVVGETSLGIIILAFSASIVFALSIGCYTLSRAVNQNYQHWKNDQEKMVEMEQGSLYAFKQE